MRPCLLAAILGLGGCTASSDCSELGPPSGLATHAALLRVTIYPAPAQCQGNSIDAGGAAPLHVLSVAPSALGPIALPRGAVAVLVQAYGDTTATTLLGQGCSTTVIGGGASTCLALPISAGGAGDGGATGDGGCPLHDNGVGQRYAYCAPVGPVNAELAMAACQASGGDTSKCKDTSCNGGSGGRAVCKAEGRCVCWTYTGSGAGLVHSSSGGGCDCGVSPDPMWN